MNPCCQSMDAQDVLYKLGIFQDMYYDHKEVLRVPGGWLFYYKEKVTFVPYNPEFKREFERR